MDLSELTVKINKYYILSFLKEKKGKWVSESLGKKITIPTLEKFDIFIVKVSKNKGLYWRISESYTGFRLYKSDFPESQKEAISNLLTDMKIKKIDESKFVNLINKNIKTYGLSPRYK